MADGALGIILCSMKPGIERVGYYGPGADIKDPACFGGPAKSLEFQPMCCEEGAKGALWEASEAAVGAFLNIDAGSDGKIVRRVFARAR